MSGPQFLHIQSYSRKANKIGQSVQQILDEAGRAPEFCQHVENPEPPNLIYGLTPLQVREKHDEIVESGYVEVALFDTHFSAKTSPIHRMISIWRMLMSTLGVCS
ncbi:hypothetical protein MUY21_09820 [Aliiroseovarius sp. S2029]|uniref:hypothetical protein n=1 Tax=Aliiroseovarius sp. S2029 TaxID=2936988 RepID=UPI0020C1327B|nr:hypothetical protein [Aliiroseovarius sp. S2029]MCK8484333.1 hypothetical protein [Aliiroseovarius sp. S2029]